MKLFYHWLGDRLGGFRTGGYQKYTVEAAYMEGLKRVESLAEISPSVLVCAERLPWKCHRLHIAQSISERGWSVVHVLEKDRDWQPRCGISPERRGA